MLSQVVDMDFSKLLHFFNAFPVLIKIRHFEHAPTQRGRAASFFFNASLLLPSSADNALRSGNLLFISGQLCSVDGKVPDLHKGKVGTSEGCVTQEEA